MADEGSVRTVDHGRDSAASEFLYQEKCSITGWAEAPELWIFEFYFAKRNPGGPLRPLRLCGEQLGLQSNTTLFHWVQAQEMQIYECYELL